MTKLRVFCASLAIMLVLAACAISDAFTLVSQNSPSPFENGAQVELDQIQTIVDQGEIPHDQMLQQVDSFVAQVDQMLDDGAANELELLDARDRAIQIRAKIESLMARQANGKAVTLVQGPQPQGGDSMQGPGGSEGSPSSDSGSGGSGGSGGGGSAGGGGAGGGAAGGAGGAGGGLGASAGSLGGLAGAAGATVSATNNNPGPASSESQ